MAQQLDLTLQALIGDPINLAETVAFDGSIASGAVSVSASGLVAYRAGGAANRRQLTWFDRTGKVLGTMGSPDENGLSGISLSADSQRGAVVRTVQSNADIWLIDSSRTSRFTFDASLDQFPIWSPDGRRIAFRSNRTGAYNLDVKPAGGASAEALLVESSQSKTPSDWSADGRFLMYLSRDPQTDFDLWVRPMEGDQKPWVFLNSPFTEKWGRFSPDGRWVAYMSNESGQIEVYVRPFALPPASGSTASMTSGQWQVSTTGGAFPAWRADGRALYYLAPTAAMMEAPMTMSGAAPAPGTPVLLFPTHVYGGGTDTGQGRQYDVAPDGRFLINTVLNDAAATPITLIQNWRPDGKK